MNKKKIWFVILPIILFIMLAVFIKAGLSANFEAWAYAESVEKMSPIITNVMKFITHIGDPAIFVSFCLILFAITKSRKTIALPVCITVIISVFLNFTLKNVFSRPRPDILRLINETDYSFPSGHAMNNAALYTILIFLTFKYIKSKPLKICLSIYFTLITIAIGYSRVYLGVHYAGDILGGWLLGFAVAISVYFLWNGKLSKKENL